jgi:CRP-like cAMP-binding protein
MENLRHLVIADIQLRTPPRIYDDEEVLFRQGSKAESVFFIESGEVALFLSTLDRRMVFVKTAGPGEVLALSPALNEHAYAATARALVPLRAGVLRRQDLHALCVRHPGLREAAEECVRAAHARAAGKRTAPTDMASKVLRAALHFLSRKSVPECE